MSDSIADATYIYSLGYALANYSDADILIINFPAARGKEGEDTTVVVNNLIQMQTQALGAGIGKVWMATSQPSPDSTSCHIINSSGGCHPTFSELDARTSLYAGIVAQFPGNHIDFFTPLSIGRSLSNSFDLNLLNFVDMGHPNLMGHEALRDAVINAGVFN